MNNEELTKVKAIFTAGFMNQISSKQTMVISGGVGIMQGTKYKGSLMNGIKAAGATAIGLGVMNGVWDVLQYQKLQRDLRGE